MVQVSKPEEVEGSNAQVRKTREVKRTPLIPSKIAEAMEENSNIIKDPSDINDIAPIISIVKNTEDIIPSEDELSKTNYSIKYNPLCGNKIPDIPLVLHYKAIDGFNVTKLNELNMETIDEGLNEILDGLCYETKSIGFTHWKMTVEEKIRSYINLRLNSVGPLIEHLIGICQECGKEKIFVKVEITKFDEKELNSEYIEPFPLKVTINKEVRKLKVRLIRSGDIYRAKQIYEKDKNFINKLFPNTIEKDISIIHQIIEYANTIKELDGNPISLTDAVILCKDNIQIMNVLTSFNDYFYYGMELQTEDFCDNKECPSIVKEDKDFEGKEIDRRSQFRFPFQPTLFHISYTEKENVKQYFDLR